MQTPGARVVPEGSRQSSASSTRRMGAQAVLPSHTACAGKMNIKSSPVIVEQLLNGYLKDAIAEQTAALSDDSQQGEQGLFQLQQELVRDSLRDFSALFGHPFVLFTAGGTDSKATSSSDSEPEVPIQHELQKQRAKALGVKALKWRTHEPLSRIAHEKPACQVQKDDRRREDAREPLKEKASSRRRGGKRRRGGAEKQEKKAGVCTRRQSRLLRRAAWNTVAVCSEEFDISRDGSVASTGWHGRAPPRKTVQELLELYESGKIKGYIKHFTPIPYDGSPVSVIDAQRRLFMYRASHAKWLGEESSALHSSICSLLSDDLLDGKVQLSHQRNGRGPHLACILGHYRQYQRVHLTSWHRQNQAKVDAFLKEPIVLRVIKWVESVTRLIFPGVAQRFEECARWHKDKGAEPLFGVFWNLCINAAFPDQPRVHCKPHADRKNIVGVCALLIYEDPRKNFDHTKKSWLVIWEAGVVVELPPWTLLLYPSSLLYHFNIDIDDVEFVTAEGDEPPTKESCQMIGQSSEEGRGSMVFFNEAMMYQSSETGFGSLREARGAGFSGITDYGQDIQQAFTKAAVFLPAT